MDDIALQGNGATVVLWPAAGRDRNLTFKLAVTDDRGRLPPPHQPRGQSQGQGGGARSGAPQAKLTAPPRSRAAKRASSYRARVVRTHRWTVPAGISAGTGPGGHQLRRTVQRQRTPYRFTLTVSNSRGEIQASHTVAVLAKAYRGWISTKAGTIYKAGDKVVAWVRRFECKIFPYSGWCNDRLHYMHPAPVAWRDAWTGKSPHERADIIAA